MARIEIKHILCPTDFSEPSANALEHAVPLARWYGAKITALHVLPLLPTMAAYPVYLDPPTLEPLAKSRLIERLRDFLAPADAAAVSTDLKVLEGSITQTILEQASAIGADLIAIGTHGRGGFERWMLGSVAEKVIRKASCAVMTVGQRPAEPPTSGPLFARILCAVDFFEPSRRALDYALSLAQEAKAVLHVAHVVDWGPEQEVREHRPFDVNGFRRFLADDAYRRLRELIPSGARSWCRIEEVVTSGKPYAEILRLADELRSELIVMSVRGRRALDLAIFGSTTNQVVRAAECPVLTVREA